MKKILIVNKSFGLGGIQSSMVNMANELSNYYEVELFVYNPIGVMKERLNDKVKVLEPSWRFRSLEMSLGDAFRSRSLKIIIFKLFASAWTKLINNKYPISIAIKSQTKLAGYDLAIAYHQEQRKKSVVSGFARVVDKCVDAKVKVAWLHFDSNTVDIDRTYNNKFYAKLDKLVCVSKSLRDSFAKNNPELGDKVDYCYNFMLYGQIKEKSNEVQAIEYPKGHFVCFSACRLSEEKGLVRAIEAIADVLHKHSDVNWYIAGDGPERYAIEQAIEKNDLKNQIVLIGNQRNPYPYFKNADLVLNVSYHEAAPMVFFESKCLGVPVLATETSSARELLNDGVDSFVCDNSIDGIRNTFENLMENRSLIVQAKKELESFKATNEGSLSKIKSLTNL